MNFPSWGEILFSSGSCSHNQDEQFRPHSCVMIRIIDAIQTAWISNHAQARQKSHGITSIHALCAPPRDFPPGVFPAVCKSLALRVSVQYVSHVHAYTQYRQYITCVDSRDDFHAPSRTEEETVSERQDSKCLRELILVDKTIHSDAAKLPFDSCVSRREETTRKSRRLSRRN